MKKVWLLILIQSSLFAQENSGYIYKDSVIKSLKEYSISVSSLMQRNKELNDTFDLLIREYELLIRTRPHERLMDSVQLKSREEEVNNWLHAFEKKIDDYKYYSEKTYAKLSDEWDIILNHSLAQQINSFCKEQNIQFLLDRTAILYCKDCKDYTQELIRFIVVQN